MQGLFISFLVGGGVIDSVRDGKNLQNFLICIEMLGASFGMVIAFPYTEYKSAGLALQLRILPFEHVLFLIEAALLGELLRFIDAEAEL